MRYAGLVSTVALLAAAAVSNASDITVEGDGLEPIAEYDLTGDTIGRTVINEAEMAELEGAFPFSVVRLDGKDVENTKLVYFDEDGNIEKCIRDEYPLFGTLYPIGNEGYYVTTEPGPFTLDSDSKVFVLYRPDGDLICRIPGWSVPAVPQSNDIFAINNTRLRGDKIYIEGKRLDEIPYFATYDLSGNLFGESFIPIGVSLAAFDKDADSFIALDPGSVDVAKYPDVPRGTRIFDKYCNLLFTLNDNTYVESIRNNDYNKCLYGSNNYICQIGNEASLKTYREGKYALEYYEPDRNEDRLEVYGGDGDFLWAYKFPRCGSSNGTLFLSDNEEFLCLVIRSELNIKVFETSTGEIVRELGFPSGNPMYESYISDDGSLIALKTVSKGAVHNIAVFRGDDIVSSFTATSLTADITPDGRYLLIGNNNQVILFKTL
jgi:hypothetical protein